MPPCVVTLGSAPALTASRRRTDNPEFETWLATFGARLGHVPKSGAGVSALRPRRWHRGLAGWLNSLFRDHAVRRAGHRDLEEAHVRAVVVRGNG